MIAAWFVVIDGTSANRGVGLRDRFYPGGPTGHIWRHATLHLSPFLKASIAAFRKIQRPSGFTSRAGAIEVSSATEPVLAVRAAGTKAKMPFPAISMRRVSRLLNDDHADADADIVDVPSHRSIVDALPGEFGHAPSTRARATRAKDPDVGLGTNPSS